MILLTARFEQHLFKSDAANSSLSSMAVNLFCSQASGSISKSS